MTQHEQPEHATSVFSRPLDHSVRLEALDPTRSFIVEAPAGSGKTELLTQRYLKLLACVQAPEEILAITFTRKAAAEMRARVLKALALTESSAEPTATLQRDSWKLAREAREADELHGWKLAEHPARLRIMTIDALNNFLARQLPILSGAGAALNIARDSDELYAQVALRLIERLSSRDLNALAVETLLRHLDNRYDTLVQLLARELARREYWLDLGLLRFDLATLRDRLEHVLNAVIDNELTTLRKALPLNLHTDIARFACQGAAKLKSTGATSPIVACDELTDLPPTRADHLAQWQGIAELLLTREGDWRKTVDVRQGFPPAVKTLKQSLLALIATLQSNSRLAAQLHAVRGLPAPRYAEHQWQVLAALLDVLKLGMTELELVMRERGEADYVANAIAARRALGTTSEPTDLALRIDYTLKHILVDEFQDTSHGQIELLTLLTAGWTSDDARTLFCVGDPMQSIYRFRNADVGLFLNLKQHGLNQLHLSPLRLTVNFRASQPVLEWINRTFAEVLPPANDAERGAVTFTASSSRTDAAEVGGVYVHPIIGDKAEARVIEAQEIVELIAIKLAHDTTSRIAVLVPSRSHLEWIIEELKRRQIAYVAVEIDPLAERPAVQDLLALTRALVHLADRTAWLSILRAPWCGVSIADLHALVEGQPQKVVWELMGAPEQWQRLSSDGQQRLSILRNVLLHALPLRGRLGLRDCVERTWLTLGGPATVDNNAALQDCHAYLDRLEEIERQGDLEDISKLEKQIGKLYASTQAQSGSRSRVELMTIHRAKGLEFDVVILPALDKGARTDEAPLLRAQMVSTDHWNTDHRNPEHGHTTRGLLLAPIGARGADKDSIYQWMENLDKERARFEKGRVLYVAATRAESELHLFGAVETNDDGICKPPANTFLSLLWPTIKNEFSARSEIDEEPRLLATDANRDPLAVYTRRVPSDWHPIAPQARSLEVAVTDVIENQPLLPQFQWVGETARHVGTLVHREAERIANVGLANVAVSDIEANRDRYEVSLAELGVPSILRSSAAQRVLDAVGNLLRDERGRWLMSGNELHREAASEFALSGLDGSELVNGVIDRTFVDRDDARWIIDFKTSSHEGGGVEEFLDNEVERYREQLQRYARLMRGLENHRTIKIALYFPLLSAWREVPL